MREQLTRFDLLRECEEIQALMNPLQEKFLKQSDPSVSILNFIENMANTMGNIKKMYATGSRDRNKLVEPILQELEDIQFYCERLKRDMQETAQSPEDKNDSYDETEV